MKIKILLCLLAPVFSMAQEDLLAGADTLSQSTNVESAFKGLKIVNIESTKLAARKDFYFIVAHRFGSVEGGFESFYGLDDAVTQLKFVYGVTDWLSVSAARSELAYDFASKVRLVPQQTDRSPVNVVGFASLGFNNKIKPSLYPGMKDAHRLIYVAQVLVSRKFNDRLSLEVAPSFFHENFVLLEEQHNSQYALGVGGRYKFAKRWSVNMDYVAHLNRASESPYKNPLSIGVDLETGGHVFQMHFTNAQPIHEAGFMGQASGDWTEGNIFFGFNLLRVF